jgi:uncharacterized membrane protein
MASIRQSVEIARRPEDVFAYLEDLSRHGEWQEEIVSVQVDTDGPTKVGSRATEERKAGGRVQTVTYEVTEHDPPRSFAFRGINGPIRVIGEVTVEPVGDGSRSRVTVDLDFEGRGAGKLLRPLVMGQARKAVPKNQQRLKERLESGAV